MEFKGTSKSKGIKHKRSDNIPRTFAERYGGSVNKLND